MNGADDRALIGQAFLEQLRRKRLEGVGNWPISLQDDGWWWYDPWNDCKCGPYAYQDTAIKARDTSYQIWAG